MKKGKCFESAMQMLMDFGPDNDFFLVHGLVIGNKEENKGIQFGHAWLERGKGLLDTESGKIARREKYYKAGQIKYVVKYDYKAAINQFANSETYGPWDEVILQACIAADEAIKTAQVGKDIGNKSKHIKKSKKYSCPI